MYNSNGISLLGIGKLTCEYILPFLGSQNFTTLHQGYVEDEKYSPRKF